MQNEKEQLELLLCSRKRSTIMGANNSSPTPPGPVTVHERPTTTRSAAQQAPDPDIVALRRLPPVAPLMKPPTLRSLLFTRAPDPSLPALSPRNMNALCREYASLARHAAIPLCEEQRKIAQKISSVEALCARVLYLMALRSRDVTSSANALRDIRPAGEQLDETRRLLQHCITRAERCEQVLHTLQVGNENVFLDGGPSPSSSGLDGTSTSRRAREAAAAPSSPPNCSVRCGPT